MLSILDQDALARVLFPVGDMTKDEVRARRPAPRAAHRRQARQPGRVLHRERRGAARVLGAADGAARGRGGGRRGPARRHGGGRRARHGGAAARHGPRDRRSAPLCDPCRRGVAPGHRRERGGRAAHVGPAARRPPSPGSRRRSSPAPAPWRRSAPTGAPCPAVLEHDDAGTRACASIPRSVPWRRARRWRSTMRSTPTPWSARASPPDRGCHRRRQGRQHPAARRGAGRRAARADRPLQRAVPHARRAGDPRRRVRPPRRGAAATRGGPSRAGHARLADEHGGRPPVGAVRRGPPPGAHDEPGQRVRRSRAAGVGGADASPGPGSGPRVSDLLVRAQGRRRRHVA